MPPALEDGKPRCSWVNLANPRYVAYHDTEWGVATHDETQLFALLNLEGAQAGLSWETILNRRDGYEAVFRKWDAEKIAAFRDEDIAQALQDFRIVRNRLKVAATVTNARTYVDLRSTGWTLDAFLWGFVDGRPVIAKPYTHNVTTPLSDAVSKGLKSLGFRFVGSTIVQAYLQAVGVINDHQPQCFCRQQSE